MITSISDKNLYELSIVLITVIIISLVIFNLRKPKKTLVMMINRKLSLIANIIDNNL